MRIKGKKVKELKRRKEFMGVIEWKKKKIKKSERKCMLH